MSHSRGKLQQGIKFQLDAMHSFTIIKKYLTLTCTSMVASKKKRERCGPTCLPAIITGMLTKHHSMCRRGNKREREMHSAPTEMARKCTRTTCESRTLERDGMATSNVQRTRAQRPRNNCLNHLCHERERAVRSFPSVQRSTDKSFDKIGLLTDMCRATRLDFAPTLSLYHKRF